MYAFHVFSTKPIIEGRHISALETKFDINSYFISNNLDFPDYSILLALLLALKWKQLNGRIKLYTDSLAASIFHELGILSIWNDYDTEVLDKINWTSINPTLFWPAVKFFAYLNEKSPCVYIDLDLIIWKNIHEICHKKDVLFTHQESVKDSYWYCQKEYLRRPEGYEFKKEWSWEIPAANTSLIYFGDSSFKDYYSQEALRYITNNSVDILATKSETPESLFAEQRLLTMCAKEMSLKALPFIDATWSPIRSRFIKHDKKLGVWNFHKIENQPLITHAWFYKRLLESNVTAHDMYCRSLVKIILDEFPDIIKSLKNAKFIEKYTCNLQLTK